MKRILYLSMALALLLSLTACGGNKADTPSTSAPSEVTPAGESLPTDGPGTESEAPAETGDKEEDPLLLSFDFPNAGVSDDGTKNPPKYIVTLHGGVEVEMEPGIDSLVKLDGFGKTSNASNTVGLNIFGSNGDETLEFPLIPSLTWSDIEAGIRETLDLRDDVVFHATNPFNGLEECQPQEFMSVMAQDDYGNMTNPDAGLVLYNPTENVLPLAECSVASILPGLPDDAAAGNFSAESVCENLGEPACVQLIWDGSSLPRLKSVNYYWVCDGFYARYSTQFANYNHGNSWGVLRYIVDNPTVVEYYMADVAAFLME